MKPEYLNEIKKTINLIPLELGFKKCSLFYCKKKSEDAIFTIAFNFIKNREFLNVEPHIGIYIPDVQKLKSKLLGLTTRPVFQPIFSVQLGYILPGNDYKDWIFENTYQGNMVIHDLKNSLVSYAIPFFEKLSDTDYLISIYEKRDYNILNYNRDRILPILYFLKGEKELGLKLILESIDRQFKKMSDSEKNEIMNSLGPNDKLIIGIGNNGLIPNDYLLYYKEYQKL